MIVRQPRMESYGTVAVFEDLYGNLWDLIEPKNIEEFFYSTAIIKIREPSKVDLTVSELKKLREVTLAEQGCIYFHIRQVKEDQWLN